MQTQYQYIKLICCQALIVVCLAVNSAKAQYTPATAAKIKAVESSLAGWVQTGDTLRWTLAERMKHWKVKGLSIAVIHHYRIEWAKGYGWADSAASRPVTTHTLFEAASISKSINGMGILTLVQAGKLDLYADINRYLLSWKFPYDSLSKGKKITTANLLSHTAGLNLDGFTGYLPGALLPTVPEILDGKSPANNPPVRSLFEPNLKFLYSGGGVTITQQLLSDITHQAYSAYMYRNVLRPMGMYSSVYEPPPARVNQLLATSYNGDGTALEGKYHNYPSLAAAGLWSNPSDLARYVIETQLAYQGRSAKVLNQHYTHLRLMPYIDTTAALGVFIQHKGNRTYFTHEGSDDGFLAEYYGSLEDGDGVVVMLNGPSVPLMEEVINSVALVYHWKGFYNPFIKHIQTLSPDMLARFSGKYRFQKNKDLYIQIKALGGGLLLTTLWDHKQYEFLPESDLSFFTREQPFPLRFSMDTAGKVAKLIAFDQDVWDRVE
jgi:CubicO group peptidase (beta-lactamase class C family)